MSSYLKQRGEVVLGMDIGGANIKLSHGSGVVRSRPFALWRAPERLAEILLEEFLECPSFDRGLLTMTAELCDCFRTKREGVLSVLDSVESALGGRPVSVWGVDGQFHPPETIRDSPGLAAASNWRALAELAATIIGREDGLLIDLGSTTTDLIPITEGRVAALGSTDSHRLRASELVYLGVRRTPLCAVAASLPWRGAATRLMAELFATTLDVYLTLGDLPDQPDDLETADGRPSTREYARERMARMVGADRDSFDARDAIALAEAADAALMLRLREASSQVSRVLGGRPRVVVTAGSGEFLARRLAHFLLEPGGQIVSMGELRGALASSAACSWALTQLWGRDDARI